MMGILGRETEGSASPAEIGSSSAELSIAWRVDEK